MADRYWVGVTISNFSVFAQETSTQDVTFKSDGTKMYVIGSSGDDVNEYDLSSAWDVTTASFLQTFSVSAQETTPTSVFFKGDGTKMYVLGSSGDDVNEYDLSSAWDISTASYLQTFSVSAQETIPQGLFFKPDGTKMYVIGIAGDDVNEYDLSSAWDVSTASYLQNFSVSSQETSPTAVFFKSDGTKMYVLGSTGDDVNEYNLSSAWDVSTASYLQRYSVVAQESNPTGLFFKPDGTKMFMCGTGDNVWQYTLSTPWDITSVRNDVWDGTADLKWATTSGGAGGASVPTTSDNVFLDANSLGTVTISTGNTGANSINCTGFTGTVAGTAAITVAGSITLVSGMTYSHTGTVTLTGTGTLTTAGKTFSALVVDGSGITVTLGDAFSNGLSRDVTITQGTLDTAGYAFSTRALSSSNTNTRGIALGASAVTLAGNIDFSDSTNLTFNAGTSTITMSSSSATITAAGQTFYDVTFSGTSVTLVRTITGANTFNDLSVTGSSLGLVRLSLDGDQTINGTFSCAGTSSTNRKFVYSSTLETAVTLTANAISADDCDFRDITLAGTAAGASPTRAGDCGNNSGITFPAGKTTYRVGSNTTWQGSSSWALTSGGAGSNDNFPLAQDTAIIDNSTTLTGTLTSSVFYNLGTFDASSRTTGITFSLGNLLSLHGDFLVGSGVTLSGSFGVLSFYGPATKTINTAGKTVPFQIGINPGSGAVSLGAAFTSTNVFSAYASFDANNYNMTCSRFRSHIGGYTRTITMGSGLWTLSGNGTVWEFTDVTGLTFNKDTANILLSDTGTTARTFDGGGLTYNKLTIGGATGTSVLTITGVNSFTELASDKTVAHTIRFGSDLGTIDTWSVSGTSGNVVTVNSTSAGVRRTFTLTNITEGINYLSVTDIGVTDPDLFYVGSSSIDGGNNLNVIFSSLPAAGGSFLMLLM